MTDYDELWRREGGPPQGDGQPSYVSSLLPFLGVGTPDAFFDVLRQGNKTTFSTIFVEKSLSLKPIIFTYLNGLITFL